MLSPETVLLTPVAAARVNDALVEFDADTAARRAPKRRMLRGLKRMFRAFRAPGWRRRGAAVASR